ncbi:MAG: type I DNA topoisomerase [Tannerella sp.]|nr:type I DNA topoisomerase [Tannerella sp.]
MQKKLVIVESPAKAKTIEKFLGEDYKVMSSYGHIRDLKAKEFSVDVAHDYAPQYVIPTDKRKLVSELKNASAKVEQVLLASDEDREGEAIAWHLSEALSLKPEKTRRIVFHEITKNAILHALAHPRGIDINLVNAQQARRVLDRIVGFELSPILWRKIKPTLSAGRVQSVAVRLLVDREREIQQFVSTASYRITADFILSDGKTVLKTELNRRLKDQDEAQEFLTACMQADFVIDDIATKPFTKSPAPPFTTSTLQQEAARKLRFSVSQTMTVAQHLYESGHITYMRTDSFNLSNLALGTAKEVITETYGAKYHRLRRYQTKSKGAQEAHEAIRPAYMNQPTINGSLQEKRLYDLIYKRTIACQMADAELERTTISIGISNKKEKFVAVGEVIRFDGFLHVYMESPDDDAENEQSNGLLPPVSLNEALTADEIVATERFTQRPPRYTEATLVHRMEELGIGRPSTYAPTIQTIQHREYVIRGDKQGEERRFNILTLKNRKILSRMKKEIAGVDRNKLIPTDTGIVVNDFLMDYFPDVLDYHFTASVEKEFDAIAEGELVWTKALDKFYKFFHPIVESTSALKTERKIGERQLGIDPASGEPVFVKIGRFGPVVQIGLGKSDDNKDVPKPRFTSLRKDQSIESITLEEALKLFELPRTVGEYEAEEIIAGLGRFGPFIRYGGKFIAIQKPQDPSTITEKEAIGLIENMRTQEAQRVIKQFEDEPDLEVLNGRFGPYIKFRGNNYRIPKNVDPAKLTPKECHTIIGNAPEKPEKKRPPAKKK